MSQPPGFEDPQDPNKVCKLPKALYGLWQAPRVWFDLLKEALLSFGFHGAREDQSLFIRITTLHTTFVLVYVDDIFISGSSQT